MANVAATFATKTETRLTTELNSVTAIIVATITVIVYYFHAAIPIFMWTLGFTKVFW